MADMTPLTDILNGDPADATDVQNNFQTIEAYINGTDLVRTDGTEVMTADLDMDGNTLANISGLDMNATQINDVAAATLIGDVPRFDQTGISDYVVNSSSVTLPNATPTTVQTMSVTTPAAGMALVVVWLQYNSTGVTYGGGDVSFVLSVSSTVAAGTAIGSGSINQVSNATSAVTVGLWAVLLQSGANTITISATATRNGGASGGTTSVVANSRHAVFGAF